MVTHDLTKNLHPGTQTWERVMHVRMLYGRVIKPKPLRPRDGLWVHCRHQYLLQYQYVAESLPVFMNKLNVNNFSYTGLDSLFSMTTKNHKKSAKTNSVIINLFCFFIFFFMSVKQSEKKLKHPCCHSWLQNLEMGGNGEEKNENWMKN